MVWGMELAIFGLLVVTGIVALSVRDLLAAVAALTVFSVLTAVLLALMGAVDVALTEIALGAGITGVLIITAVSHFSRRSED